MTMATYEIIKVIVWIFLLAIIIYPIQAAFRKVCLPNTAIIIDRNTHYFKTIRAGSRAKRYSLRPTDMVTSVISTKDVNQEYTNIFVTHDNRYYRIHYFVSYQCEDIDTVLNALQDSRRSIYDIINNAVSIAVKSLSASDFSAYSATRLRDTMYSQIESMLEPFYIDFKKFVIDSIVFVDESIGEKNVFVKHESQGESPIQ